jgi:hypothetical protein
VEGRHAGAPFVDWSCGDAVPDSDVARALWGVELRGTSVCVMLLTHGLECTLCILPCHRCDNWCRNIRAVRGGEAAVNMYGRLHAASPLDNVGRKAIRRRSAP